MSPGNDERRPARGGDPSSSSGTDPIGPSALYGTAAAVYYGCGWAGVLPLPERKKTPPPKGFTGDGPDPTQDELAVWIATKPMGNVALRMPANVLGIDVDAYEGKAGAESLAKAEAKWGELPKTWTSTSRLDGQSGIRFFQVPEGMAWPNTIGPGIETIRRGHRYAVVSPSVHPSGALYYWIKPDGESTWEVPKVVDLAELPAAWVEGLTNGAMQEPPRQRVVVTVDEGSEALAAFLTEGRCGLVEAIATKAVEAVTGPEGSRHDAALKAVMALLGRGQRGHGGVRLAMVALQEALLGIRGWEGPDEWRRMTEGAVELLVADEPEQEECRGEQCGKALSLTDLGYVFELSPSPGVKDPFLYRPDFWAERPVLQRIHDFAVARMTSPWAVLGVALARVVTAVPPELVLPPTVGGAVSLNLFVALVGVSGAGKGSAEAVASEAVNIVPHLKVSNIGSGEGLVKQFAVWDSKAGEQKRLADAVLFSVPEVDLLGALNTRNGSTLQPMLKQAFMGEHLGMGYADPAKAVLLGPQTYRACIVLGVQPGKAQAVFQDEAGGTPQRFIWLPVTYPDLLPEPPEAPSEPWPWRGTGVRKSLFTGQRQLTIPDLAASQIKEARYLASTGQMSSLDGHRLLCQLKVAAAFASLDERHAVVEDDDWRLAGVVMDISDRTRTGIQTYLMNEAKARNISRGKADGEKQLAVEEVMFEGRVGRVARNIANYLARMPGKTVPRSVIAREKVAARDRDAVTEALERLVAAGRIEAVEGPAGLVYRWPEAMA